MARYTTAGYGREVCEAAGECVYTPEDSSVVIEAGSCKPTTYVSRAILAGVWVAFFQRVPAMIVRTGTVQGMRNNGWSDEAIEHIDAVQQQVGLTL